MGFLLLAVHIFNGIGKKIVQNYVYSFPSPKQIKILFYFNVQFQYSVGSPFHIKCAQW